MIQAQWFQRRRFLKKFTDGRQVMAIAYITLWVRRAKNWPCDCATIYPLNYYFCWYLCNVDLCFRDYLVGINRTSICHFKTRGSAHWACIAHLTIEWYWSKFQREIIITLKNSMNGGWGCQDTILKGTHPGTIYARFGPYIDASCQVWLHLAKLFQRRRFFQH